MAADLSLTQIQEALLRLIEHPDHDVIALTGAWGSGKTHLWREIESGWRSQAAGQKVPVYASLFGVKTIAELKLRLLKQLASKDRAALKKLIGGVLDIAKGLAARFSGIQLDDIVLTWLPDALTGRLVVIDDVERAASTLSLEEVLGFIDEYSELHGARFLLLLNNARLGQAGETWATLHEKVIDVTSPVNFGPAET